MRSLRVLLLSALAALSGAARAGVSAGDVPAAVLLDRHPEKLASLSLGAVERDRVPQVIEIDGPWRLVATVAGVRTWEAEVPARTRTLFFHRAPAEMDLIRRRDGRPLERGVTVTHRAGLDEAGRANSWDFDTRAVRVRRDLAEGRPAPGEYGMRYAVAAERERGLDRGLAGDDVSDVDFVFRSVQVDDTTRHGLYLPPPAEAVFDVDVPEGGRLVALATVIPPEAGPQRRSDGATVILAVDGEQVGRFPVAERVSTPIELDLARWGGRSVKLGLSTEGGGDGSFDYVFVAEPTVYTPQADPPRVVVVFVDTLRTDHLSLYGYQRPTTPKLDAWAEDAAVFEDARSVAPWTLPSTRTLFTGAEPERWGHADRLQDILAARGWSTAFVSGNVYLSSNFDMADGWGTHRCVNWPNADVQVDRALAWLDDHADRPGLLVLHFMDMHLPYTEPPWYRFVFAGAQPDVLNTDQHFIRSEINRAEPKMTEADRQYVRDRYDNNLRFVDDQVAHLLESVGDDAVVVVLSDHGEEFWDHGGFEHGHTLYDELLRVPLVVKAPGMTPGRYTAPVSLLDVMPTVLRGVGVDLPAAAKGWPLQELADGSRTGAFESRPLAFGRPLYGYRRWGVLEGDQKYTTTEGEESIFDIASDAGEQVDLVKRGAEPAPMRAKLAEAVGTPAGLGFRLVPSRSQRSLPLNLEMTVPGGVLAAWAAEDPLGSGEVDVLVDGESLAVTWYGSNGRSPREVFVIPEQPAESVLAALVFTVREGGKDAESAVVGEVPSVATGEGGVLSRARVGGRKVDLTWAVSPVPLGVAQGAYAFDAEVAHDLEALGYVEH